MRVIFFFCLFFLSAQSKPKSDYILILGPSAAGKSYLSREIIAQSGGSHIDLDEFKEDQLGSLHIFKKPIIVDTNIDIREKIASLYPEETTSIFLLYKRPDQLLFSAAKRKRKGALPLGACAFILESYCRFFPLSKTSSKLSPISLIHITPFEAMLLQSKGGQGCYYLKEKIDVIKSKIKKGYIYPHPIDKNATLIDRSE